MRFAVLSLIFCYALILSAQEPIQPVTGKRQSPINIETKKAQEQKHSLNVHFESTHEHIKHETHSVKLVYDPGSFVYFDSTRYDLRQFHYHTPSEHYLDGVQYPVEMHMVHEHLDEKGYSSYLVIAVLYTFGKEDVFLNRFIDEVPTACIEVDFEDKSVNISEEFVMGDLEDYFHYEGSLTTPPYTETVDWLVLSKTHTMSADQIVHLSELEGRNNRELQSIEGRKLEHCSGFVDRF